jgi:RNA polymerase sigma factor (sigma-70 family)
MTDDEIGADVTRAATGDREAAGRVLTEIQDPIYRLALRMLGHPADAEDATQEILIIVLTHLGSFRGESSVRTWVFRIAANHIVRVRRGRREADSLEALDERLERGLATNAPELPAAEAALVAREVRLRCSEAMLLGLDRELRMAIILGDLFELPGEQAAAILEIEPAAYRKRLSRARTRLVEFMQRRCGLVEPTNRCRCARQAAPAVARGVIDPAALLFASHPTRGDSGAADEVEGILRAAEVLRSHPDYATPEAVGTRIRELLRTGRLELLRS